MDGSDGHEEHTESCNCKIGTITDRYELSRLDDDLVRYWTGAGEEQMSTRELMTFVNQSVLEAATDEAGMQFKDGEIENTYRLLTSDDVSSGTRIQTRSELERELLDIEQVESDFVSHQTVYNHLTNCLGASLDAPDDRERLERSKDRLSALQNRTLAVTNDTVDRLSRNGALDIGEFNILVNITITCEDCQRQYTARELFERGSCDCYEGDE